MKAIFKREIYMRFNSGLTYIFAAIFLLGVGLCAMMYNISSSIANFEYVLYTMEIVFVLIVPILTMRSMAEERKQKTDQLLYSLPISMSDVVLGKYLSTLCVYAAPLLVTCIYPIIFKNYGNVYLPTSYGAIAGFFFLGAALIAIGIFFSAITDIQAVAAGLSAAAMVLLYFLESLASLIDVEWIANLLTKLSPFARFDNFVEGVFDIPAIIYLASVAVLFIFFTVQVMDKRRYN